MSLKFNILKKSKISNARVGEIITKNGVIRTPNFVPVATNGIFKAVDHQASEPDLLFSNTYHLMLHPGTDVVAKAGGLNGYTGRKKPFITDSGGFQIFSLQWGGVFNEVKKTGNSRHKNSVLKITEDGVEFRSYRDGSKVFMSPESCVEAQKQLNADIIIPLDEVPGFHTNEVHLKQMLDRTHRWETRSLAAHLSSRQDQSMYAVVHGGLSKSFREQSARYLSRLDFDGFAIGGSLGESSADVCRVLSMTQTYLPSEAPKHLLGIGDCETILHGVEFGIDTFDSSYPTKIARHGQALTKFGKIKLTREVLKTDFRPIDDDCFCHTCKNYSRAFIYHLFKTFEPIVYNLVSIHNLYYMDTMMQRIREDIMNDRY